MSEQSTTVSRRSFLDSFTKAAALSTIGISAVPVVANAGISANETGDDEHRFLCKPYLHSTEHSSMYVRWITNKNAYCWIEFNEPGKAPQKAHAVNDGLVNANNRVHEIKLSGLKPATTYEYKIAAKEIKDFQPYKLTYGELLYSDVFSFTTYNPSAKETQWLVLNDIHDRPASFNELIQLNGNDPYQYVFLNGDMFDYQTNEQQIIDHLLTPCSNCFATQKPMLFVRGNHETRGRYARQLKDYFAAPQGAYFSYQSGPVFTIALDTGEDKEDTHPVYAGIVDFDQFRIQQAAWLEQQLQSKAYKKAKYKVVMMHIPPFYSGEAHGVMHCRELFTPLFDKYKIDLLICGHTHTHGIHAPVAGKHSYPIIIGGGPTAGKRTLIKVHANQQELQVRMLKDDGSEAGTYTISPKR
ncbi:metallophosphoesterase family protein [Lacibacter luteus]|uniref:Metallophosphoesterase family protein n=1 Tax=Lacibacter luteus TaxID=2508719 RepID=A0A4Q1CJL7_9BACT|nr:FN3 domain-containing metallophosphoesterase family protein [Lacibacter luteus]RXK60861.1 metallophosphoesterase family protein [Lacibacter luteus]